MHPTTYLRAEGLALFLAATGGYLVVGEPLWLYLLLFFLPDLSMLGYLGGPAVGARVYNLAHVSVWALVLAGVGVWLGIPLLVAGGLVWLAHLGADRALGYGLKHEDAFGHTHLGRPGRTEGVRRRPVDDPSDTVR
jgi:hypothetical protein